MKSIYWILGGIFLLASTDLVAKKVSYKHWTHQQLETKVKQLQRKNDDLEARLALGQTAVTAPTEEPAMGEAAVQAGSSTELVKAPDKKAWILDDFEKEGPALTGQDWYVGHDENNVGSKIEANYAAGKHGQGYHLSGFMPANAEPWPWVLAELPLSENKAPTDLRAFKTLEFWVKGDGKLYQVKMHRMAVKDFAFPFASFKAPTQWTKVSLPLADFAQPDWAVQVAGGLVDVHQVVFAPLGENTSFDFSIDDLTLVK